MTGIASLRPSAVAAIFGLATLILGAPIARAQTVVTPANMGNWAFDHRDSGGIPDSDPTAGGSMVLGPATPPLGTGSANLFTGNGASGGDGAQELRNTGYSGVRLGDITSLSFSTFVTSWNGQQTPYLALEIDPDGLTGGLAADSNYRLFFEPGYQTPGTGNLSLPNQGLPTLGTWQTWDALNGGWWSNLGGAAGAPGTGVVSLSAYLALFPDATIVNTASGLGGVQMRVGFASVGDVFNGNVDNLTIGVSGANTTYDFETNPVPEPASLALLAAGLLGLGVLRRRPG